MSKGKSSKLVKVGITVGDLNGVGMETILKALSDPRFVSVCTPIVYGSAKAASFHKKIYKGVDVHFNIIDSANQAQTRKPNLVNLENEEIKIQLGKKVMVHTSLQKRIHPNLLFAPLISIHPKNTFGWIALVHPHQRLFLHSRHNLCLSKKYVKPNSKYNMDPKILGKKDGVKCVEWE